jgi:PAS domain-containing protein
MGKDSCIADPAQRHSGSGFFKDAAGRYLIVNKAFEDLLALSQEDIVGKNVSCMILDRDFSPTWIIA